MIMIVMCGILVLLLKGSHVFSRFGYGMMMGGLSTPHTKFLLLKMVPLLEVYWICTGTIKLCFRTPRVPYCSTTVRPESCTMSTSLTQVTLSRFSLYVRRARKERAPFQVINMLKSNRAIWVMWSCWGIPSLHCDIFQAFLLRVIARLLNTLFPMGDSGPSVVW